MRILKVLITIIITINFSAKASLAVEGANVKILGFSRDNKKLFVETTEQLNNVGHPPLEALLILDVNTKKIIKSYSLTPEFDPENSDMMDEKYEKDFYKKSKAMREKAFQELKKNYSIVKSNAIKLKDFNIGLQVTEIPESKREFKEYNESTCTIYLKSNESNYLHSLSSFKCIMGCGSMIRPSGELKWEEGYEGQKKLDTALASGDEKTFLAFYYYPYYPNTPGHIDLYIINSDDLSSLYNNTGFDSYKKKEYKKALSYFLKAVSFKKDNVRAIYNTSCMYALLKDADNAVKFLQELKSMGNKASKNYLRKIKSDSDFNNIREEGVFKEFIKDL